MAKWLLKIEPSEYTIDTLKEEKVTPWEGVTNALAQKHMREMCEGDHVFIYHTGDEKAIVGIGRVARPAYPDVRDLNGRLVIVDISYVAHLKKPVRLAQIKADKRFANWGLVKMGRLSVVPTDDSQWDGVMALAK